MKELYRIFSLGSQILEQLIKNKLTKFNERKNGIR